MIAAKRSRLMADKASSSGLVKPSDETVSLSEDSGLQEETALFVVELRRRLRLILCSSSLQR